ncbi:MAG: capsular polysaccharide transport system permease protein [Reinekea sp.]|jgi:capsular polysaccharide transport system permease protein
MANTSDAKKVAQPSAPAKPAAPKKPVEPQLVIRPLAKKAKQRPRHWGLLCAFIIVVFLPVGATSWYLWERAVDQYASTIAFTVRSEDISSAADLLGGLAPSLGGGGGTADSDILYEFIRSQALVTQIDKELGLRGYYSRNIKDDPIFGFDPDGTIEDLTAYWLRMVRTSYDAGSGLMELRVLAFDPDEARAIATAIFDNSTVMINNLSAIAREDATRYAREDLVLAVERLKQARESLTAFRISSEIVDPTADIAGQMGLLNLLQSQQVEALIEFDLLNNSTREGDPRLEQARRRIDVIEDRIREERQKFGVGSGDSKDKSYAETIAEFERLAVDREFAEQAYAATLSAFDAARAEANRQSLYLAAYIQPTLAERAEFPNRPLLVGIVALFSFLAWAIMALVYYSLRDRR